MHLFMFLTVNLAFIKYLLSTFYEPSTVPGAGGGAKYQTDKNPHPYGTSVTTGGGNSNTQVEDGTWWV